MNIQGGGIILHTFAPNDVHSLLIGREGTPLREIHPNLQHEEYCVAETRHAAASCFQQRAEQLSHRLVLRIQYDMPVEISNHQWCTTFRYCPASTPWDLPTIRNEPNIPRVLERMFYEELGVPIQSARLTNPLRVSGYVFFPYIMNTDRHDTLVAACQERFQTNLCGRLFDVRYRNLADCITNCSEFGVVSRHAIESYDSLGVVHAQG